MNHVLIVDDEAEIRDSLEAILSEEDYIVTTAATAAEALDPAPERHYQAVLLDIWLPDGDGLDVLATSARRTPPQPARSRHDLRPRHHRSRRPRHQARRLRLPRKAALARPHPHRPPERHQGPPAPRRQPGVRPPAQPPLRHRRKRPHEGPAPADQAHGPHQRPRSHLRRAGTGKELVARAMHAEACAATASSSS